MTAIQPDILWPSLRESKISPEENLILAIIKQAWVDGNIHIDNLKRKKARLWFSSHQFEYYCDLLNSDSAIIHTKLNQYWNSPSKGTL